MADPTKFVPGYSFTNYQASNPSRPLPGDQVDVALAGVATSVGELVDGLKNVRRSDGAIQNGAVAYSSLTDGLKAIIGSDGSTTVANSTTSTFLGTGTKVFTVESGKIYTAGTPVTIASKAAPTVNLMTGVISSYVGAVLTVDVTGFLGSGTYADWTVAVSGIRGVTGSIGPAGAGTGDMLKTENLSGLANYATARGNLGLGSLAVLSAVPVNGITTGMITDLNVTTVKIADANVTGAKLSTVLDLTGKTLTLPTDAAGVTPTVGDNTTKVATTAFVQAATGGLAYGMRNKLINGDFRIWQRGTTASLTTTADAFVADRWVHYFGGSGFTVTPSRQTHTLGQTDVPGNQKYFLRTTVTTAGSISANRLAQRVEGVNTLAGSQFFYTCYIKASSAFTLGTTNSIMRQNFGTGGSPSSSVDTAFSSFTVNDTAITTSWKKITVTGTLPSITGKTLGTNGNDCLELILDLPLTNAIAIDISSAQLEVGSVATPFEDRGEAMELALCARYCPVFSYAALNKYTGFYGYTYSTTTGNVLLPLQSPTRVDPTGATISAVGHFYVTSATGTNIALTNLTFESASSRNCMSLFITAASGLTAGAGTLLLSQNASAKIIFTGCEL